MKRHPLLLFVLILVLTALACEVPFPPSFGNGGDEPSGDAPTGNPPVQPTRPVVTPQALPAGMPSVDLDYDRVFETLVNGEAVGFEDLAVERYADADFAAPGTLTFTVSIPSSQKIFWQYGWCAADEATLRQNMEHIKIKFLFNGAEVDRNWAHSLGSQAQNGWQCAIIGMLLSDWKPGIYKFETVAIFDTTINDGGADFAAGDYIFKYDVSVK